MLDPQYHDIVLTDIQLHVTTARNPKSLMQQIMRTIRKRAPYGRAYFNKGITTKPNGMMEVSIPLPQAIKSEMDTARGEGKMVRLLVPKDGLPIVIGKDIQEFMRARERRMRGHQ